jgi:anti-sigma regulatory factor (Ser/Thr protein kinase)
MHDAESRPYYNLMLSSLSTAVHEISQVGQARREAQRMCSNVSSDLTFAGRVAIVVTELARNLVLHAGGGHVILRELRDEPDGGMEVLSLDRGPGMRNVGECLRDGYSTAGTPGTGLGAIRRMSDLFDLSTTEGRGTVICARVFAAKDRAIPAWDVGAINVPITGETICGDAWATRETPQAIRVMLADGLGHGIYAAEAAQEAVAVFLANAECSPGEVLSRMNSALTKTRGAAAAVVELHPAKGLLTLAGAGNISVRIIDNDGKSRQLASVNGTVGAKLHKIQEFSAPWTRNSLLIMHSDGLTSHWDAASYPGLLQRHAATIGGVIYRDYSRGRDDATILTVSHHR